MWDVILAILGIIFVLWLMWVSLRILGLIVGPIIKEHRREAYRKLGQKLEPDQ